MHPIEQLRHLARAGDLDGTFLAVEAADALAELAREPRALVPACRRLLEHHLRAGPLWWLCAEVLADADPASAARRAAAQLVDDPTVEELAASLPGGAACAGACSMIVVEAMAERPDCSVRLVGSSSELRRGLRAISGGPAGGAEALGFEIGEIDEALGGASLVLVEAQAAGTDGALLAALPASLCRSAAAAGVPIWLVAGTGRVLAPSLFRACAEAAGGDVLSLTEIAVVIGPGGAMPAAAAVAGRGGAVPPELLHWRRG